MFISAHYSPWSKQRDKVSLSRELDKEDVGHMYYEILFMLQKR